MDTVTPGMKQVATATATKIGPAEPWPRLWILGSQVASFLGANDVRNAPGKVCKSP
jgi:hypothetical protein